MFQRLLLNHIIRLQKFSNSTNLNISNNIKIPNKIYRNELSVLKALAKCVQLEAGASWYPLINDPWLYPKDFNRRKSNLLSKASGKLSARLAFQEIKHEFIKTTEDEPRVKSLLPLLSTSDIEKKVESEELTPEKGLNLIINLLKPKEAWQFFETYKSKGFSQPVLQNLLELLCSIPDVNIDDEIPSEEVFYMKIDPPKWRLDNEAELLFQYLPSKTKEAYDAMIRGSSSCNDVNRAFELFNEFKLKFPNDYPELKTCNSLLKSIHYMDLPDEEVEKHILQILNDMARHKISPNVLTFNGAIFAYSNRVNMDFVEQLYQEMLSLDIKPILGTYAILLKCSFPKNYLLSLARDIVGILEDRLKTIDYEDILSPDDLNLFRNMMELFRNSSSLELAFRLHDVATNCGRLHLIDNYMKRGSYADNLMKLMVMTCWDVEVILKKIQVLVPNFYIIQASTIDFLLKILSNQKAYHLIPNVIDIVNWNNTRHMEGNSLRRVIDLMLSVKSFDDRLKQPLAKSLDRFFELSKNRQVSSIVDPDNILRIIEVIMKLDDWNLLWKYVEFAGNRRLMTPFLVQELMEKCIPVEEYDKIIQLAGLMENCLTNYCISTSDEKLAMDELLQYCHEKVVPVLEKNVSNMSGFLKHLSRSTEIVQVAGKKFDESSTSSSSSSESDSSDEDEPNNK